MDAVREFLSWLAVHGPELRVQMLADMQAFYEQSSTSVAGLAARRDIAWRLSEAASSSGFAGAAAYYYEAYELVCRALAYALEGMW